MTFSLFGVCCIFAVQILMLIGILVMNKIEPESLNAYLVYLIFVTLMEAGILIGTQAILQY